VRRITEGERTRRFEGRHVVGQSTTGLGIGSAAHGARAYAVLTVPSPTPRHSTRPSNHHSARPLSPPHSPSHRLSIAFATPYYHFSSLPCSFYYFLPPHPLFLLRHSLQVNILSFALSQRELLQLVVMDSARHV